MSFERCLPETVLKIKIEVTPRVVCAAAHRAKSFANPPVLFFSGAAYEADKKRAIDAGASAYVCKPDLNGLLGSITQFISRGEGVAA